MLQGRPMPHGVHFALKIPILVIIKPGRFAAAIGVFGQQRPAIPTQLFASSMCVGNHQRQTLRIVRVLGGTTQRVDLGDKVACIVISIRPDCTAGV